MSQTKYILSADYSSPKDLGTRYRYYTEHVNPPFSPTTYESADKLDSSHALFIALSIPDIQDLNNESSEGAADSYYIMIRSTKLEIGLEAYTGAFSGFIDYENAGRCEFYGNCPRDYRDSAALDSDTGESVAHIFSFLITGAGVYCGNKLYVTDPSYSQKLVNRSDLSSLTSSTSYLSISDNIKNERFKKAFGDLPDNYDYFLIPDEISITHIYEDGTDVVAEYKDTFAVATAIVEHPYRTVLYDSGDGNGKQSNPGDYDESSTKLVLPESTFTGPADREFEGWLKNSYPMYEPGESVNLSSNTTTKFTAQYKSIPYILSCKTLITLSHELITTQFIETGIEEDAYIYSNGDVKACEFIEDDTAEGQVEYPGIFRFEEFIEGDIE